MSLLHLAQKNESKYIKMISAVKHTCTVVSKGEVVDDQGNMCYMVRLPCYMDVTTAQVSFLLWAAPTRRFTQQVATQDTSDCCACQET